jgi:hypothetical protein
MIFRRIYLVAFLFVFAFGAMEVSAQSLRRSKTPRAHDPYSVYWQAKRTKKLRRLSITERISLLDSARAQASYDTIWPYFSDPAERTKIVVDVVMKTPAKEVSGLLDSMNTTVALFRNDFSFLPSREMEKVTRHLNAAIGEPDSNSRVFTAISSQAFRSQLRQNLSTCGDSLFQSHSTSFCGKTAFARLWIQQDSSEYKRFMTELYYTGRSTWNDIEYVTPPEVIKAINENKIQWDPQQKVKFKDEEMPQGMDMVFYLTLTSRFRSFPFTLTPYDPDLHHENRLWSATAINPQLRLFRDMGFEAEKVGNNVRGITNFQFNKIKAAADSGTGKQVFLLVNSSVLDTVSGADSEYVAPHNLEYLHWGTHWITVDKFDVKNDRFTFWEYGRHREVKGIEQMKEIIAGGIIVSDYKPE